MICRCVASSCSIPTLTLIANRTTARQMHTDEALASPDWLHRYIVASSKLPVVAGIDDPGRARFHRTVRIGSGAHTRLAYWLRRLAATFFSDSLRDKSSRRRDTFASTRDGRSLQNSYGPMRSVSVSLWKAMWSRKRSQPLSFFAVCATLVFSPVAKSSHELKRAMVRNVQGPPSRCC